MTNEEKLEGLWQYINKHDIDCVGVFGFDGETSCMVKGSGDKLTAMTKFTMQKNESFRAVLITAVADYVEMCTHDNTTIN